MSCIKMILQLYYISQEIRDSLSSLYGNFTQFSNNKFTDTYRTLVFSVNGTFRLVFDDSNTSLNFCKSKRYIQIIFNWKSWYFIFLSLLRIWLKLLCIDIKNGITFLIQVMVVECKYILKHFWIQPFYLQCFSFHMKK